MTTSPSTAPSTFLAPDWHVTACESAVARLRAAGINAELSYDAPAPAGPASPAAFRAAAVVVTNNAGAWWVRPFRKLPRGAGIRWRVEGDHGLGPSCPSVEDAVAQAMAQIAAGGYEHP